MLETPLDFNQQGPPGPKGDKGDKGDPATTLFAHVTSDAHVAYGPGVTAVSHTLAGFYDLTFNRPINNCVGIGNVGADPSEGGTTAPLTIITDHLSDPTVLRVVLWNHLKNDSQDSSFSIAVFC